MNKHFLFSFLLLASLIGAGISFTNHDTQSGKSLFSEHNNTVSGTASNETDSVSGATDKHGDSRNTSALDREITIPAATSAPASPSLSARYACLMDADSGRILYAKDSEEKVPMASTTKIMTLLLALESRRLEETVTASAYAASMPKVHLGMVKGYQYRLKDLLYSLMLESHNDTAVAIAEHLAGSVEAFAAQMNQKAAELGLESTHFITPNGLDADGHFSTAADLCHLAACAIKNPDFLDVIQTKTYTFSTVDGKHQYSVSNKDAFLSYYEGALGVKTGFTSKAGYCFVGAAKREGRTFTSCVLACGWPPNKSYKWTDTRKLMDYGFENYELSTFPLQNLSKITIPVKNGKKDQITCRQPEPRTVLISPFDSMKITYELPGLLCAPLRKDAPVGTVSYYINDKLYCTDKIFLTESIEKSDISDTIRNVFNLWMESFGATF